MKTNWPALWLGCLCLTGGMIASSHRKSASRSTRSRRQRTATAGHDLSR